MAENKQAQNVCYACNSRKKACDKALPACSFCTKRGLLCRYDIMALERRGHRAYNPGRNFVALQTEDANPSNGPSQVDRGQKPLPLSVLCNAGQSLEESVNQQVQHVIQLANLQRDDISERYFQTFHQWLPIVSPDLFLEAEDKYRERRGHAPPADFSILLLAMYLIITIPNLSDTSKARPLSRESLYKSVKLLFSQVQAVICTSLPLVQALLIIAMCEYACARGEAAYISMATCTGLARLLGLRKTSMGSFRDGIPNHSIKLVEIERENVTWGIAMLERIILSERDERGLRPLTEYPNPDSRLPSDLHPSQLLNKQRLQGFHATESPSLLSLHVADVSHFGKQAQVVSLLNRILRVTRFDTENEHNTLLNLAELAGLDSEIRNFLAVIMEEESRSHPSQVVTPMAVALCIRSMFLLHRGILDASGISQIKADHQTKRYSRAALDVTCQMVVDAARCHGLKGSDVMPLCCYYNLRDARQHLQERNSLVSDEALSRDIDCLLQSEEGYRRKWVF